MLIKKYRYSNSYLLSAERPASNHDMAHFAAIVFVLFVMVLGFGV